MNKCQECGKNKSKKDMVTEAICRECAEKAIDTIIKRVNDYFNI